MVELWKLGKIVKIFLIRSRGMKSNSITNHKTCTKRGGF